MTKGIHRRLNDIERHSTYIRAKNADTSSRPGPIKDDHVMDAIFVEVEKERAKMKLNNGIVQSVEYN